MGFKGVSFAEYDEFPLNDEFPLPLSKYGHVIDSEEWFRL
jgi:hypothetical protein